MFDSLKQLLIQSGGFFRRFRRHWAFVQCMRFKLIKKRRFGQ